MTPNAAPAAVPVSRARVALVDDDDLFRESVARNLTEAGYEIRSFSEGSRALDWFGSGGRADLVLLDWKMPEMNGIEVLRRMRLAGLETPVIFLTGLTDQIYEEAALTGGAVDFVEKSRSFGILLKRIELILAGRKGGPADAPGGDAAERIAALELRPDIGRAFWKGRQIDLTLTEFRMVHHLASRAGEDVPYRDLYDLVHGKDFVAGPGEEGYRANVRTFIKRIRQKFRDVDDSFEQIENYPGFGYRWRRSEEG
jgi:two-component system, OmpR family, response regulator ChvI